MPMSKDIEKLKNKYLMVSPSEVDDALGFVVELLELQIDDTKKNEPYANRTIEEMKTARNRVHELFDLFEY